ncbi:MAG: 7TM-DISM domain-containing protein, partial [Reichenbachiella sp.]|uniref:7TM-DISM domain-containing protein n=1 Tax=Reichenbachiella sp. TaxID=2184521 RepID=UPI0032970E39
MDLSDNRSLEVSQYIEEVNVDHIEVSDWLKNQGVPEESEYYTIYGRLTLLAGQKAEEIVLISDADVDYFFISKNSNLRPKEYFKSGKKVPQEEGAYFITMINAVPIALIPNEEVILIIKVLSKEKVIPNTEIRAFEPVDKLFRSRLFISYIFTAILFTFATYHFALAFYTKDRVYFYYSYYVISFAAYASLVALSTFFSASVVMPISVAISSAVIALSALFAGEFLKLKSNLSQVIPIYKGLIYHAFLVSGMLVLNAYLESLTLLNLLATATAFIGLFSITFWIYVGFRIYRNGNLLGRLFLITNVPILVGATFFISVWILMTIQWIMVSTNFALLSNVVFQISVISQLFLFSYFVGYSIKKLQVEKLQIQQTINLQLEQQVAERTASLMKANGSIED